MGLITNLIKMNQEKKQSDAERHLKANESLLKLAGLPEEQLYSLGFDPAEFRSKIAPTAIDNIVDIYGKNVGKEHKQGGGIIKTMLSGLAGLNPAPRDEFRNQQTPKTPQAQPRTQADIDKFKQQRAAVEADIEAQQVAANEKARKTEDEKARQTEIQNRADGLAKAKSEGLIDDEQYKTALAEVYAGRTIPASRTPAVSENATEKVYLKDKTTGQTVIGRRDPKTGKVYNIANRELDPAKYEESEVEKEPKEPAETGSMKQLTDAYIAQGKTPAQAKVLAGKDVIQNERLKERGAVVRIENAQQQNTPLDEKSTQYWAEYLAKHGSLPLGVSRSLGRGALGKIMAEVPQIARENGMSVGDVLGQQADIKALGTALTKMETQYAQVESFEKTAEANLDRAVNAAKKIVDSGSPLINRPWREAEKELLGKPEYGAFHAARVTAYTEVAKVLSGSLGNGAVSDSARKESEGALGEGATLQQLIDAADILKQDMQTRTSNMQETIKGIKQKIGGGGVNTPTTTTPPPTAGGNDIVKRLLEKYK